MKILIGAIRSLFTFNVNADVIKVDWMSTGDNLIAYDNATNLE